MRLIWILSNSLSTKIETLIMQGTLYKFHITGMAGAWRPSSGHNKYRVEDAKPTL